MKDSVLSRQEASCKYLMIKVPDIYIQNNWKGRYLLCPFCDEFVLKGNGYGKCKCGNLGIDSDMLRVHLERSTFNEIFQYWNVDPFHTCPVCGYQKLQKKPYQNFDLRKINKSIKPPYEIFFGAPTYDACLCCGYKFGNHDNPGKEKPISFLEYRTEWIQKGAIWVNKRKKPKIWTLEDQLARAGL
jgi:hypothetical protein